MSNFNPFMIIPYSVAIIAVLVPVILQLVRRIVQGVKQTTKEIRGDDTYEPISSSSSRRGDDDDRLHFEPEEQFVDCPYCGSKNKRKHGAKCVGCGARIK